MPFGQKFGSYLKAGFWKHEKLHRQCLYYNKENYRITWFYVWGLKNGDAESQMISKVRDVMSRVGGVQKKVHDQGVMKRFDFA
jgi:hypothetical protein